RRPSCNSRSFRTMTWCCFEFDLSMASSSWLRVCSLGKISKSPHCFLIGRFQRQRLSTVGVCAYVTARAPLDEPHCDRKGRSLSAVGQTAHPNGLAEPDRGVEDRLRRISGAHQARAAAGDHDAGRKQAVEARLANLLARHLE